jgi:hypothetical protein
VIDLIISLASSFLLLDLCGEYSLVEAYLTLDSSNNMYAEAPSFFDLDRWLNQETYVVGYSFVLLFSLVIFTKFKAPSAIGALAGFASGFVITSLSPGYHIKHILLGSSLLGAFTATYIGSRINWPQIQATFWQKHFVYSADLSRLVYWTIVFGAAGAILGINLFLVIISNSLGPRVAPEESIFEICLFSVIGGFLGLLFSGLLEKPGKLKNFFELIIILIFSAGILDILGWKIIWNLWDYYTDHRFSKNYMKEIQLIALFCTSLGAILGIFLWNRLRIPFSNRNVPPPSS